MFNRTIQLDVVKKNVKGDAANQETGNGDISAHIASAVVAGKQISDLTLKVVGTYMVLDTIRKIAVNRLSK